MCVRATVSASRDAAGVPACRSADRRPPAGLAPLLERLAAAAAAAAEPSAPARTQQRPGKQGRQQRPLRQLARGDRCQCLAGSGGTQGCRAGSGQASAEVAHRQREAAARKARKECLCGPAAAPLHTEARLVHRAACGLCGRHRCRTAPPPDPTRLSVVACLAGSPVRSHKTLHSSVVICIGWSRSTSLAQQHHCYVTTVRAKRTGAYCTASLRQDAPPELLDASTASRRT